MNRLFLPLAAALLAAPALHAQSTIVPGEVTRGALRYDDPRLQDGSHYHDYVFEGRRGETVIVTLSSQAYDTYLYLGLLDRGFAEIGRDDDGGGGTDSRLELQLPESGTYVIRASSLMQATGPYTLTLTGGRQVYDARGAYDRGGYDPRRDRYDDRGAYAAERDPRPLYGGERDARGGPLDANRPVRGFIGESDPALDGGERVTILLRSDEFDSYLVLGTPGGRHGIQSALARDDDGGGGRDARIVHTFQYDGDYAIRVNPLLSGGGRYTLELVSDYGY